MASNGDLVHFHVAIKDLLDRGFAPIPVPSFEKAPKMPEWQKLKVTEGTMLQHFSTASNVGVLLGDPSGGLVDIDCDSPQAVMLAESLLPETHYVFGRQSKPKSHYIFIVDGKVESARFQDDDGNSLVEIRSTGAQTIFPPSVHPSKEKVEFYEQGAPARVNADTLRECVQLLAAASLLAKNWPQAAGSRQDIALALSGGLLRHGWSEAKVKEFIGKISGAAGDTETKMRMNAVDYTAKRLDAGGPATGIPTLIRLLKDTVVGRIQSWLGWNESKEPGEAAVVQGYPCHLTDTGNAALFSEMHSGEALYCHPWKSWLIWDGSRWAVDRSKQVIKFAKRSVQKIYALGGEVKDADKRAAVMKWGWQSESERKLLAMVALSQPELPVDTSMLDASPYLLNCINGTLHLQSGILMAHKQEDLITKRGPVRYDEKASAPRWVDFIHEIMDGDEDLVDFLQVASGYSLTGLVTEQCLFFCYGTGANGKSTFLNTMLAVLGEYATQTDPNMLMMTHDSTHPTGIADLKGMRFAASVEVEEGKRMAEVLVKQLTGGDTITARRMHQDFFSFHPTHKIWLAANHKPPIRGTDVGIWRRIRTIPFTKTFSPADQDKNLQNTLMLELPGILNWLVDGCRRWFEHGLVAPEAVQQATEAYKGEMDTLQNFISQCCVVGPGVRVPAKQLYKVYSDWCESNGEFVLSHKMFSVRIREKLKIETSKLAHDHATWYLGISIRE